MVLTPVSARMAAQPDCLQAIAFQPNQHSTWMNLRIRPLPQHERPLPRNVVERNIEALNFVGYLPSDFVEETCTQGYSLRKLVDGIVDQAQKPVNWC